jgi:hypothetical protein
MEDDTTDWKSGCHCCWWWIIRIAYIRSDDRIVRYEFTFCPILPSGRQDQSKRCCKSSSALEDFKLIISSTHIYCPHSNSHTRPIPQHQSEAVHHYITSMQNTQYQAAITCWSPSGSMVEVAMNRNHWDGSRAYGMKLKKT